MKIEEVTVAEIYPCKIWAEKDLMGTVHIKMQHQVPGEEPFTFIQMHYNYAYTSNGHQADLTEKILELLGAK
jgi:hypothetical protein